MRQPGTEKQSPDTYNAIIEDADAESGAGAS